MGLKDWIAPFITLLIGASTIFISYKNYQAQAAAKPSELARLELWSKLLTEAGLDLNALPDPEKLTSDQRVVLENYRVFLKRASLESKLRKVGIDSNRIFSLLMKRAHSSVKPTPIPIGDSVRYYRLILRGLLYIWVPLAVVFIGVPIIVVTIVYLIGLFTNHRGNLSDFALSPLAVVLLIVGAVAVGSLVYLQNRIISAIIANNVYFYFWDIYGSKKGARDSKEAYSERLAAKTYADQLFLGQQEFAHQFRENMYMAGIQEIDEYPRVLSDSVMLPRNYRVAETTEGEDRIDRFVNWVRSKIGFERLEPRIIYTLEHKDAHKDERKEAQKESARGEPVAPNRVFLSRVFLNSLQRLRTRMGRRPRKYPPQKNLLSPRCPLKHLPRIWLMRPPNPLPEAPPNLPPQPRYPSQLGQTTPRRRSPASCTMPTVMRPPVKRTPVRSPVLRSLKTK